MLNKKISTLISSVVIFIATIFAGAILGMEIYKRNSDIMMQNNENIQLVQNTNQTKNDTSLETQKQKKIEMLGSELEEACKNYGKIRVSILSKQLISYGELSIPIFTKLLWTEKGLGEGTGAWGLGEIKSEKAVDTLIEKFQYDDIKGLKDFDIMKAIGKIGGEKAKKFLEKQLDRKNGVEFGAAVALLKVNERHERAEEVLIELIKKDKAIRGIISEVPQLLKYRKKEVVEGAISILREPKNSDYEILSASEILIKTEYENADDILIEAFDIQKDELARSFIIERLGKLKNDKVKIFLNALENKSDKEISPFLKSKIKEIKGK